MKKEWQKVLKSFVDYHSKKIEGMTEEEEIKYVKENKINEKIQQLQKEFIKKYSTQKKQSAFIMSFIQLALKKLRCGNYFVTQIKN